MDVSAVNRTQSATVQPMTGKLGVIVAQRSIEAARQNQAVGSAGNPEKTGGRSFQHPYLGHNVDIYI